MRLTVFTMMTMMMMAMVINHQESKTRVKMIVRQLKLTPVLEGEPFPAAF